VSVSVGRPSGYGDEIADRICDAIASTPRGLEHICAAEDMPAPSTVYGWLNRHPEFLEKYLRARAVQAHVLMDQCVEIADDVRHDTKLVRRGEDTDEVQNAEFIQRSKIRIDTRMRMAGKLNPKHYGDKQLVGSDPDNPLPAGFTVNLVKPSGE
jgi:hypothetical protein